MNWHTWEHITLGNLRISKAKSGRGPSGNQYLVCLHPFSSLHTVCHMPVAARSISIFRAASGSSEESASGSRRSCRPCRAAVSADLFPMEMECPLTHFRVTDLKYFARVLRT